MQRRRPLIGDTVRVVLVALAVVLAGTTSAAAAGASVSQPAHGYDRADAGGITATTTPFVVATNSVDDVAAGGPVRSLDASRARINTRGTDLVESHLKRFAEGGQIAKPEAEMLGRLRSISNGDMSATIYDQNFYTHELREMVRYRQLGYRTGQPSGGAGYDLWNDAHTATLEDYGISDADVFFPGVGP